jgi:hypothetical protein
MDRSHLFCFACLQLLKVASLNRGRLSLIQMAVASGEEGELEGEEGGYKAQVAQEHRLGLEEQVVVQQGLVKRLKQLVELPHLQ